MKFKGTRHSTDDTDLRSLAHQLVDGVELLEFTDADDLHGSLIDDMFPDHWPDGTAVVVDADQVVHVQVNGRSLVTFCKAEG